MRITIVLAYKETSGGGKMSRLLNRQYCQSLTHCPSCSSREWYEARSMMIVVVVGDVIDGLNPACVNGLN